MHREANSHNSIFWVAGNSVLALMIALLVLMVVVLFTVFTAQPAQGQTYRVIYNFSGGADHPARATEAAQLPQYASRLRPSANPQKVHSILRRGSRLPENIFYANGPINGICDIQSCAEDAWGINYGYAIANSIGAAGTVNSLEFAFWLFPGDTVTSVDWALGTTPFGSDIAYGTASGSSLSQVVLRINSLGYNIVQVDVTGLNASVDAGAWLTLQNATVSTGNPVYWDENNGPSLAEDNVVGTIPSESFNVSGAYDSCNYDSEGAEEPVAHAPTVKTPAVPAQNFTLLHEFSGADGSYPVSGLIADRHANLLGTTSNGGNGNKGLVYKLTQSGSNWLFAPLYLFQGGRNDGASPASALTLGQDGTLYTATVWGGGPGCYWLGCGTILSLKPGARARASVMGQWLDNVLFSFTEGVDLAHPEGDVVQDQEGNLYSTTYVYGAHGRGSVYEIARIPSGWQYRLLYSFTGGRDGNGPINNLLIDHAGNLFGATYSGGAVGCGAVFELSPSPGGWTQQVIYDFRGAGDGAHPQGLTMDSAGNLYGVTTPVGCATCPSPQNADVIFKLSPTYSGWSYSAIGNFTGLYNATINMGWDGNLYGTTAFPGLVYRLVRSGDTWTYTDLHDFVEGDGFWPEGSVAVDAAGNVYGITNQGGTNGAGVVWKITP